MTLVRRPACAGGRVALAGPAMAVLLAGACISAQASTGQRPDTRELVRRTTAYVERYAAELKFVLADEEYLQRTFDDNGRQTGERRMRGELFLVVLPADGVWMAVHDIADVDGTPVARRDELRALLRRGEVTAVARQLADRNASFNLGSISRNFNEPTLPLLLFDPKRVGDIRFRRRERGTEVALEFEERDRATLVRSRKGSPVRSRGEITIDPASGRVEATTMALSADGIDVRLETTYALDEKIGLWVPSVFTEWYRGAPKGREEVVVCEARYTNYRRFEVLGRIK